MNVRRSAAIFVLALAAAASAQTAPSTRPASRGVRAPKQLYFAVGFRPALWRAQMPPGFLPAVVEGGGRFVGVNGREDSYWVGGYGGPNEEFVPAKLRLAASTFPPGTLYVLDQEKDSWSTDVEKIGPIAAEQSKRRYRAFSDEVRAGNADILLAFYDKLPDSNFWLPQRRGDALAEYEKWQRGEPYDKWSISHAFRWDGTAWQRDDAIDGAEGSARFFAWQKANTGDTFGTRDDGSIDASAGLDDAVDVLTPSLYTFYRGDDGGRIEQTIAESRRLAGGRKIYPFLWPAFHNSNREDGGKPIPIDQWRMICRRVLRQADGCVLWGADPVRHAEHIRVLQEEAARASLLDGPVTERARVDATQPSEP